MNEIEYIIPKQLADDFNAPKLIKHDSCQSIFHEHWSFGDEITFDELVKSEFGNEDDDEPAGTLREIYEQTKENGFWAFAKTNQNEIHVWLGDKMDFESLLMVLGHELGHLIEFVYLNESVKPEFDETCEEAHDEIKADGYGIAAVLAHRFASTLLNQ